MDPSVGFNAFEGHRIGERPFADAVERAAGYSHGSPRKGFLDVRFVKSYRQAVALAAFGKKAGDKKVFFMRNKSAHNIEINAFFVFPEAARQIFPGNKFLPVAADDPHQAFEYREMV